MWDGALCPCMVIAEFSFYCNASCSCSRFSVANVQTFFVVVDWAWHRLCSVVNFRAAALSQIKRDLLFVISAPQVFSFPHNCKDWRVYFWPWKDVDEIVVLLDTFSSCTGAFDNFTQKFTVDIFDLSISAFEPTWTKKSLKLLRKKMEIYNSVTTGLNLPGYQTELPFHFVTLCSCLLMFVGVIWYVLP